MQARVVINQIQPGQMDEWLALGGVLAGPPVREVYEVTVVA